MVSEWLGTSGEVAGLVVLSALGILTATIVMARIVGLRTFSKMSSFDFAITVATGSIIASITVTSASLANGVIGLATLLAVQWGIALLRRHRQAARVVDNTPRLLLWQGAFVPEALSHTRVTRDDVRAKLREANCLRLADARAVVLETTGDISVLHGDGPIDDELLDGVIGAPPRQATAGGA